MADIQEIVDVTITANTLAVSQQGFGTMLILGVNQAFPERIRYYNTFAAVAADFSPTSAEYQAAALAFGQVVRPSRIAIGRVFTSTSTNANVSTVLNNYTYTVTINGKTASFNSGNAANNLTIATGLANAINGLGAQAPASPQYVTATADGIGGVDIVPAAGFEDYGIRVGTNLTLPQAVPSQTWVEALDDITNVSDEWYALVALTRQTTSQDLTFSTDFNATSVINVSVSDSNIVSVPWNTDQATTMQDLVAAINGLDTVSNAVILTVGVPANRVIRITGLNGQVTDTVVSIDGTTPPTVTLTTPEDPALSIASWVNARKKIYVLATAEEGTLTNPGAGIAAELAAAAYRRTIVLFNRGAIVSYPEAAWLGRMVPTQPGAATWMFKNLSGVVADDLSDTESSNARNINNTNTYEFIGGIAITRDGITSSRAYIDIVVGIDWLESRIEERVYQSLVAVDKVPFTDAGIAVIESALRAQLDEAVSVGLITDDYQIQVPKAADISLANKAIRLLPDVFFTATLSGAIQKVIINGTISV